MRALLFAALLASALAAHAQEAPPGERAGDAYRITRISESADTSDDGSSGSSYDKDTVVERVIALRGDGLELEYDYPPAVDAGERAGDWMFPVRVVRSPDGSMTLRNASELEARVDPWLQAGGMTRAACGHWIFTWNSFRIECDPQAALKTVAAFDLRPVGLRDGARFKPEGAREAATLKRTQASEGAVFSVTAPIDAEAVRNARAQADLVVAEISGKQRTLAQAMAAHSDEQISGTITVRFEIDALGLTQRSRTVTRIETRTPDGHVKTRTVTTTLTREPLAADPAPRTPGDATI